MTFTGECIYCDQRVSAPVSEEAQYEVRKKHVEECSKRIKSELAIARERLGPAGWKMLKELEELRRDLADSKNQAAAMRAALEHARNAIADVTIQGIQMIQAARRTK